MPILPAGEQPYFDHSRITRGIIAELRTDESRLLADGHNA
jgi:hypothetical protein